MSASDITDGVPMVVKPVSAETVARFEAWWQNDLHDRPPVTVSVGAPANPGHASSADWLAIEPLVSAAFAQLERTVYVGDTFPTFVPNVGPDLTATLYGCALKFSPDTSWSHPIIAEPDEWHRVLEQEPDFNSRYWQVIEAQTRHAVETIGNRGVVGISDLHGNFDILAALRGPEGLCLDLRRAPELVVRAARHVARGFQAAFERLAEIVGPASAGYTTWCPYLSQQPAYLPSCDFWCLVSGRMARELILPVLREEMQPLERRHFHLDGPQALRHLDMLLELPELHAIQWVYGAGNGPAAQWIEVYERIQAAGKALQLTAVDVDDARVIMRKLRPEGVWVVVREPFETAEAAADFVNSVQPDAFAARDGRLC